MNKHRIPRRTQPASARQDHSTDGDFRVAVLTPVPALLRELKCDPVPILASAGLDLATFEHPDHRLPFATGGRLLEECAAASGVPNFGLLLGSRFELSMLGVLGQLMRNCDSVRAALLQFARHLHLNDRGAVSFLLNLESEDVSLGYGVFRHDTPGIGRIYDLTLAIGFRLMRELCGSAWKPQRVSFACASPPDAAPYRNYFRAPVHFDASHSKLDFSARWLDHVIARPDPSQLLWAERFALEAEQGDDRRLIERVRRVIQGLVLSEEVSSRRIAAELGLHERILRRRLLAQGTSINQMIGAARFEWARQLLRDTQLTLAQIATAQGYSDATAFSRAFRNWANIAPSKWRSQVERTPARAVISRSPGKASPRHEQGRPAKRESAGNREASVVQKTRTRSKT